MIVNLCNDVGDDIMMWHECCQYWPTIEKPVIQLRIADSNCNVKVELIGEPNSVSTTSEMLKKYELKITSTFDNTETDSRLITLLHFFGWPDAAAPFWPDASTSFEPE